MESFSVESTVEEILPSQLALINIGLGFPAAFAVKAPNGIRLRIKNPRNVQEFVRVIPIFVLPTVFLFSFCKNSLYFSDRSVECEKDLATPIFNCAILIHPISRRGLQDIIKRLGDGNVLQFARNDW